MTKTGPQTLKSGRAGRVEGGIEAADLLATAVLRLLLEGWRPAPDGPDAGAAPRSIALLSPQHRASMSGARGAQKPPAKEDEHG